MHSLQISFDASDSSGRGCVFVLKNGSKREVYLRARVANPTLSHAGTARVFVTRVERVNPDGTRETLTQDTLLLYWSLASGQDVEFFPGYEHFVDLLTFTMGDKLWNPRTHRTPDYWRNELKAPGIYRLHLLLTGPQVDPTEAVFEMRWPVKELSADNFSFSLSKKL
jgi:hypothetical protein